MKLKKYDTINVIPFIDVLLVLLAIVLISSTFITKGLIPVSLPEAKSSSQSSLKKELIFVVDKKGLIYLDKNLVKLDEIKNIIKKFPKNKAILINQDKNSSFESFVSILNIFKKYEYNNISIVTKK